MSSSPRGSALGHLPPIPSIPTLACMVTQSPLLLPVIFPRLLPVERASYMVHSLLSPLRGLKKPLGKFDLFRPWGSGEPSTDRKEGMQERGPEGGRQGRRQGGREDVFSTPDSSTPGRDSQEGKRMGEHYRNWSY